VLRSIKLHVQIRFVLRHITLQLLLREIAVCNLAYNLSFFDWLRSFDVIMYYFEVIAWVESRIVKMGDIV